MSNKKNIGNEIRTLANSIKRYIDISQSKKYVDKITRMHSLIIGYLRNNSGKDIFQKDIEQEFEIKGSTVTKILQLMETNGFIIRIPMPNDARLKKIVLTDKSLEISKIIEKDIEKVEKLLTYNITEDEIKTFFDVIEKMKENMKMEVKND